MKHVALVLLMMFLAGCGAQRRMSLAHQLSPGMTKSEVEAIMGPPVKSDFRQSVEEWHYCKTGFSSDEFLALFFHEGRLIEKLNYTVTVADTRGVMGSCETFIKMGNYREPDRVIEIRRR